jgi:hypothetical protein
VITSEVGLCVDVSSRAGTVGRIPSSVLIIPMASSKASPVLVGGKFFSPVCSPSSSSITIEATATKGSTVAVVTIVGTVYPEMSTVVSPTELTFV